MCYMTGTATKYVFAILFSKACVIFLFVSYFNAIKKFEYWILCQINAVHNNWSVKYK